MSGTFEARYNGRCEAGCGWPIQAGELVGYVDDQLVHAGCSRDSKLRKPPEIVCTTCWLTKPCDCEDQ